jgi:hypothetical protein
MAHTEQRDYLTKLRSQFPHYFTDVRVLEVGSLNINGTVRDFFQPTEYVGVDVAEGPGVDVIAQGEHLTYPDNSFDVVISAECFEHNPEWVATFDNMWRMAKSFVIMTCASDGRPEHGTTRTTPSDSPYTLQWGYYKNLTEEDFREHFNIEDMFTEHQFEYNATAHDLYFYGEKAR